MPRIIHFEIQAEDPARAMKFYTEMFGWKYNQFGTDEYWFVRTDDADKMAGINGAIMRRRGPPPVSGAPVNGYVNTIQVENLDELVAKITTLGGSIAFPKTAVPTVGWLCYCKDTEGNIFGLMQEDKEAK